VLKRFLAALVTVILQASSLITPPPAHAGFPGANGAIAFQRDDGDIYRVNPDGTNFLRLTDDPAQDNNPQWSPGGTKILYNSDRNGTHDIFVMNDDGGDDVLVYGTPALEFNPAWCPGTNPRVVFMSDAAGNNDIYSIDFSPSPTPIRLTDNTLLDGHPSCGNDVIVYQSVVQTGNTDVFKMNLDGSNKVNLTNAPGFQGFASISPDGSRIAYVDSSSGNGEIFVRNIDGTNPINVTNHPAADGDPAFSPDGTSLSFHSDRNENNDLFDYDLSIQAIHTVFLSQENEFSPDWQPLVDPNQHERTVTAELKGPPKRIEGEVSVVDGYGPCADGAPVELQTKGDSGWETIAESTTGPDGGFEFAPLPENLDRVRVTAQTYVNLQATLGDENPCVEATSPVVVVPDSSEKPSKIPPGFEFFETDPETTVFSFKGPTTIPAGFWGPGSEPFTGDVALQGEPLGSFQGDETGSADTIVERTESATVPGPLPSSDKVPIELVALSLTSVAPITVTGSAGAETWDVGVGLSPSKTSTGTMTITRKKTTSGTFESSLRLYPLFTFTRQADGEERILDVGALELSRKQKEKLTLIAENIPWVRTCPDDANIATTFCASASPRGRTLMVQGAALWQHGVRPATETQGGQ
jgi:hypothetical protein